MAMKWKIIEPDYLDYLRNGADSRIPNSDYGHGSCKPFFGELFTVDDLVYLTQISHPQPRHVNMKQNIDFYKIYNPKNKTRLIAVINLNYMFPVPCKLVNNLEYKFIENIREFTSQQEKSKYINLLKLELSEINRLHISDAAYKLYNLKTDKPNHPVSLRCLDFKRLETFAKQYTINI